MKIDQTRQIQQLMQDQPKAGRIIAVTSGKGGVGKTNISANLAICLAASNKKVVLLDADLGLGNLDVVMNINSKNNLSHLISGQKTIDEIVHIGPAGLEVICGGSGIEDLANMNRFQQQHLLDEMDKLQAKSDMIIVDTGAGIATATVNFCMAADQVLVVSTPEPSSMTDAYAMIKVLAGHGYEGRISLVINMANSAAEGKRIFQQIADVAKRFLNTPIFEAGVICRSDKLTAAVRKRQPVVLASPRAKITSTFAAMATRLSRTPAAKKNENGFFRKVVNLFF